MEDWRLARFDLLQKFEKQEQKMSEQEMRHKEELYEAEKSIIVGKSMYVLLKDSIIFKLKKVHVV